MKAGALVLARWAGVLLLFAAFLAPPWAPAARGGCFLLGVLVVVVTALGYRHSNRSAADRESANAGIAGWNRIVLVLSLLVAGIGLSIMGQSVVAAQTLPARPATVVASHVDHSCGGRVCRSRVTFLWHGAEHTAAYPMSTSNPQRGNTFVADPEDPRLVMPEKDFRFGRGAGRVWFSVLAFVMLVAPIASVGYAARRRFVPA